MRKTVWGLAIALFSALALVLWLGGGSTDGAETANYVGSWRCADCHTRNHPQWARTLHATMAREATPETVFGDFDGFVYRLKDGVWHATEAERSDRDPAANPVLIELAREDGKFAARVLDPRTGVRNAYLITHVLGTEFRQTYLIESDGDFFRLPIQWDIRRQRWLNVWNRQEKRDETVDGPWADLINPQAKWNVTCARCHTTGYQDEGKGSWSELGIACEACHGPGSAHVALFRDDLPGRLRATIRRRLGREADYRIVKATDLPPEAAVSVCAQCHHPDTWQSTVATMVDYEPGENLAAHFREVPLERNATHPPSNKTWPDGGPRGPGMLFRSFVESACFREGGATCTDCHSPHAAGEYAALLEPGFESDGYCLDCHEDLKGAVEAHTHHPAESEGSRCYACHMPKTIEGIRMTGDFDYERVRTHELDHIPFPEASIAFDPESGRGRGHDVVMPNACTTGGCHLDRDAVWAAVAAQEWWGKRERVSKEIAERPAARRRGGPEKTHGL